MKIRSRPTILIAWLQSLVATAGSLFFSEIMHWQPCTLCWYQRIFMYPLAIILGVGILDKNRQIYRYVFPFSLIGWLIAVYHNLLVYQIIAPQQNFCRLGIPCEVVPVKWFGFLTIPLLSLIAFSIINLSTFIYYRLNGNKPSKNNLRH